MLLDCRILFVLLALVVGQSVSADELRTNGFPSDANFFPIGVWLQSPANAAKYKAIGINVFVGLYKGPTEQQLATLGREQMFAVAEQNEVGLNSVNRHVVRAWMQEDEPDNAQPLAIGYGSCVPAAEVARRTRAILARDPTRPVLLNFGQGVANDFWRGRGSCNGDQAYYDIAVQGADILSYDIYPVGSAQQQVKGKLEYVARGVTNLVKRASQGQTVWTAIETTGLDSNRRPTAAEVRTEVWMALIHGATGFYYFVHEFKPSFREDAVFRYHDIVEEITSTNRLIKSLAPVLKSPTIPNGTTVTSSKATIATMTKAFENRTYIFAVAMENLPATVRFKVGGRHENAVRVIGEHRSLPIEGGSFQDDFEGYGVHLYELL